MQPFRPMLRNAGNALDRKMKRFSILALALGTGSAKTFATRHAMLLHQSGVVGLRTSQEKRQVLGTLLWRKASAMKLWLLALVDGRFGL